MKLDIRTSRLRWIPGHWLRNEVPSRTLVEDCRQVINGKDYLARYTEEALILASQVLDEE